MAATIPVCPEMPIATRTIAVIINVIIVIPLTGLEPTMAMALAATVVKRKAITAAINSAIMACHQLHTVPNTKNTYARIRVMAIPYTIIVIGRSCWVL